MRYFLDMCIIIYYSYRIGQDIEKKTIDFVKNKGKNKFLLCFYIFNENLPKWVKRKKIMFKEIKRKINNPDYLLWSSEEAEMLFNKDKIDGEKILKRYESSKNKELFLEAVEKGWIYTEARISIFLRTLIDEKVIPIEAIDSELRSSLFTYLDNNISDANTLASGIQENNNKELVIITADKEHWTENNMRWAVPIGSPLEKRYPILPRIEYIQNL